MDVIHLNGDVNPVIYVVWDDVGNNGWENRAIWGGVDNLIAN